MNPSSLSTSSSKLSSSKLTLVAEAGPAVGDAVRVGDAPEELGDVGAGREAELRGVRKLLGRGALFSLPLCLYALFIFVTDPFNFVNGRSPIRPQIKGETARQLQPAFWRMNEFDQHPTPNILLGDSRMWLLKEKDIEAVTGDAYFNFGYGGGTLREAVDTFWFATKRTRLERVYLGVNLDTYNETNYSERTKLFPVVKENLALYFVNRTVLQAAVYDVYSQLTDTDLKLGLPTMGRDAFWAHHLENVLGAYFEKYVYPTKYKRQLQELAQYCQAHGIQLTFVIFPSSLDAQRLIQKHKLDHESARMRHDLAALAPVYDFDYENEITADKENYRDPVHFRGPIQAQLIREIWGGDRRYARKW
jgi:hypothetical protein